MQSQRQTNLPCVTVGRIPRNGSVTTARPRSGGARLRAGHLLGEGDADGRATADGALGLHPAAVGLHQMLDDRQPETGAALVPGAAEVDAVEPLENPRQMLG